jgi:gamma-glutamyltranspeptidase/glutathione hydrolase
MPATSASAAGPRLGPAAVQEPVNLADLRGRGAGSVRSERGAVTSVDAVASRIGAKILERGGSAVDAAVAIALALAVTHPSAGNLGGGGFMLVRPAGGPTVAIDFRESAPASLTRARFDAMIAGGASGPVAAGVPGTVAGLCLAHERFGKLKLSELVAPALELAARGHRVSAREASTYQRHWAELVKDPVARATFGDASGRPVASGALLKRPALAKTLERIAAGGPAGFYAGPTARSLVDSSGGAISLTDVEGYRAKLREPLRVTYRGLVVETMPPPSGGGVVLGTTLLTLEHLGVPKLSGDRTGTGAPEELAVLVEALRRAQAERRFQVADPDRWTADALAMRMRRWTSPTALLDVPIDPAHPTPSSAVHPFYPDALREVEHTTHLATVDATGMVVSCTTTLSAAFGARYVTPDTGIIMNDSVAAFGTVGENTPAAGARSTSSMAPTLVLANGAPLLVLGTPGGDTIPSTLVQVLRHVVDHGMTLRAAVDAPRIHHAFVPDEVRFEPDFPPASIKALQRLGYVRSAKNNRFGDANTLLLEGRIAFAYADPREGGLAVAARTP